MSRSKKILIIDDNEDTGQVLSFALQDRGYKVEIALTGRESLEKLKQKCFNLSLIDMKLPDIEGIELLKSLRKSYPEMVEVVITGHASLENSVKALNAGAWAYITKPFQMEEVLITLKEALEHQQLTVENKKLIKKLKEEIVMHKNLEKERQQNLRELEKTMDGAIEAISLIIESRDPYTAGHQKRVANLACTIAREMGVSEKRIKGLYLAGLIHDLGKIHIPAEILSSPSLLTEAEYSMFKVHPQIGYDILKHIEFPWPIANIILQHHERIDGSGYPHGFHDDDILLEAKILAVADVVDAITSHRPYRPALGIERALEEIFCHQDTLYDSAVVNACLKLFSEKKF
ncbi:response regulator [bacterium]|nr:response regulator [bacterium]